MIGSANDPPASLVPISRPPNVGGGIVDSTCASAMPVATSPDRHETATATVAPIGRFMAHLRIRTIKSAPTPPPRVSER